MKKVISALALFSALAVIGAANFFVVLPKPTPSAVVGEKSGADAIAVLLPPEMSSSQAKLMKAAYNIAKADGHQDPEIVQAVLLQETQAGAMDKYVVANPGPDAYYGLMQIKLSAARDVLNHWPGLFSKYKFQTRTDDEIRANLILNQRFNIEVGSKYLKLLQTKYGFRGTKLLNAYNRGPGGVHAVDSTYHYGVSAENKLRAWNSRKSSAS